MNKRLLLLDFLALLLWLPEKQRATHNKVHAEADLAWYLKTGYVFYIYGVIYIYIWSGKE